MLIQKHEYIQELVIKLKKTMDRGEFEKKVQQEFKKLNREQIVHFTWRCAVRALPFLGNNGSFNFWNKKDRQKHIYSIFYALDVSAFNSVTATESTAAESAAAFASVTAKSAAERAAVTADYAAASTADSVSYADSATADYTSVTDYDFAFAASIAAFVASAASIATRAAASTTATDEARAAAADAADAADDARAASGGKKNMNLESIILRDLDTIQNKGEWENQHEPTDLYGEIWDSFQKALDAEGCAYWGQLYKNIFDSGFVLNPKALERRINVPKEIREQGAAAVANYLEELEEGATRLNEARIIILGDKGVGKTCIARRLIDTEAPMTTDDESTAGVDTTLWKLEHENINVSIWDFAGHTVTHAVHQFFLSERCLYIMVYDGRTEERNRLEYWLNHMKNYGGDSKAIILVNKRDQHRVEIPINTLKEHYSIVGEPHDFSIQDDKTELEVFRNEVANYIKNNPSWKNQKIPTNYYYVKEELENLFVKGEKEKGREHITKKEFNEIAGKYKVKNIEELLKDLHFLGVSLWYKDMEEFDTLVLNPEWISHGVYKIINWVNEEKKHSLTLSDFATVFKDKVDKKRYPKKQYKFLFKLMKHYELAYETKSGKELIIPHLLKEDRPEKLPDFPVGESLMLRYRAEQPLLPNTVSRFIVRHHQEIKRERNNNLVWRYGVVLEYGKDSIALVREEDRTISVSVKGKDKTNYLSRLRETLNDIFNSYKSEKPELQCRIERFGQIPDELEEKNPLWLQDRKILNQSNDEIPYYEDITRQNIELSYTVKNYNINAENLMMDGRENQFIADKSTHKTFNFHNCNIGLQGDLNDLARLLAGGGNKEEAEELKNAASALEQVENIESKEEVRKKGAGNSIKRLIDELNNKDSRLHRTVKGIKNGKGVAQDIAKGYNGIAQWLGLPQVPTPFLK